MTFIERLRKWEAEQKPRQVGGVVMTWNELSALLSLINAVQQHRGAYGCQNDPVLNAALAALLAEGTT